VTLKPWTGIFEPGCGVLFHSPDDRVPDDLEYVYQRLFGAF
jgi:hypothetical protein